MNRRQRVLFVCIGNSCRSQMAEGFARAYGTDVLAPASAGLAPALGVARDTITVMEEKNIDLRAHYPKGLQQLGRAEFDLVINMSGFDLPESISIPVRTWDIEDPVRASLEVHREIRDEIETRVMELILELRRNGKKGSAR